MKFIDWANELPSDFDWQKSEASNILDAICKRNGYVWSLAYPFVEDIIQNELPVSLLKYLCTTYGECAIAILEKYNNPEFSILTLNYLYEFSKEFVACLVDNLDSDDVARALQDYLFRMSQEDVDDLMEIVFQSDKLPEDVMDSLYEEFIKDQDSEVLYGDIVKSPSLKSEKIIRHIADFFLQLDDLEDGKDYLRDCLAKNKYLPEDVEKDLRKEAEEYLRHEFAFFKSPHVRHDEKLEMATYILEHRFVPNDLKKEVRAWLNQQ